MPKVLDSICQLFADDAKVFRGVDTKEEICCLQVDIDKLHAWSEKWQLLFNVKKCKCLHIGHNNTCHKYKMNGNKLDHVKEEKDLGVLIDDQLKFRRQAAAAVKKANRVLGLVKKTFAHSHFGQPDTVVTIHIPGPQSLRIWKYHLGSFLQRRHPCS